MLPKGYHQSWTLAHAAQCLARMMAQLTKRGGAEVVQLVLFPV
ncbi:MAG TPA: hypothetical protein VK788_18960 [Terriglobales bacterium]|nr:hypothetical protein [Terriglobales bacterium]